MLHGANSKLHTAKESNDIDVAVSPLAIPLIAGPGTIATAMNYSAAVGCMEITVTIFVFAALCLICFFCFIFSSKILSTIGESVLGIITRLVGLILSVIGVQMLVTGIKAALNIPLIII